MEATTNRSFSCDGRTDGLLSVLPGLWSCPCVSHTLSRKSLWKRPAFNFCGLSKMGAYYLSNHSKTCSDQKGVLVQLSSWTWYFFSCYLPTWILKKKNLYSHEETMRNAWGNHPFQKVPFSLAHLVISWCMTVSTLLHHCPGTGHLRNWHNWTKKVPNLESTNCVLMISEYISSWEYGFAPWKGANKKIDRGEKKTQNTSVFSNSHLNL